MMRTIIEWWEDREYPELYIISLCIFCVGSFFYGDIEKSDKEIFQAEVHDESFSASTRSVSTGMAVTSKGVAPVVVSSGHDDEWFVVVKYSDNDFEKIKVNVSQYYTLKHGDHIEVVKTFGRWTGINYLTRIKI